MGGKPRRGFQTILPTPPLAARSPQPQVVRATVTARQLGDGPLYIDGPRAFVDNVPGTARIAIQGHLNGVVFEGALIPLGGKRRLIVSTTLAAATGLFPGASATLELWQIPEPSRR